MSRLLLFFFFFFFNDTATTEIYTLSLHDALPICLGAEEGVVPEAEQRQQHRQILLEGRGAEVLVHGVGAGEQLAKRSEEHTSELQSLAYLVCRLLLEKKKKKNIKI